jgi:DNA-binding winged helix-turn-helix (wHTH) protein
MPNLHHESYWFDEFTLDLRRGCLQHGQQEIKLRKKSFEVLKYLVENSGRLVSKHELMHAVWVDTVVTDDSLVQCLKDVRHALRDGTQQIIKTVHGRGYIFNAEVRDVSTVHAATQSEEITRAVEAANTFEHVSPEPTNDFTVGATATRPFTRLAVLPFRMLRADPDMDFLAFSVPDAVAVLSRSLIPWSCAHQ